MRGSIDRAMTADQAKQLVEQDPDFVAVKRYGYSLAALRDRYPDGAPDHIIAQALVMTEDEVGERKLAVIQKIRAALGIED